MAWVHDAPWDEQVQSLPIWEFPTIRGTVIWGPYSKDPTI